jgi:hypothetical protein
MLQGTPPCTAAMTISMHAIGEDYAVLRGCFLNEFVGRVGELVGEVFLGCANNLSHQCRLFWRTTTLVVVPRGWLSPSHGMGLPPR